MQASRKTAVAILGAGPAGLTAAYLLSERGIAVQVFESHPTLVGGIARTEHYQGYRFDIGGHRFYSKDSWVKAFWHQLLPVGFSKRNRKSRILYKGHYFSYPLKPFEALTQIGWFESLRCMVSYGLSQLTPLPPKENFETWVSGRFGKRLFEIFFKTYTEKVWGMKCTEISADWAAQRIKNLSLLSAITDALTPMFLKKRGKIQSLIESFDYPDLGPGMMWEACAEAVKKNGGQIFLGSPVTALNYDPLNQRWKIDSHTETFEATHVISSASIKDLLQMLKSQVSDSAYQSAQQLKYRDFIVVALIVDMPSPIDDQWIYIHDPNVRVGRIQNFEAWSPKMIQTNAHSCFGLEYFCFENDQLWDSSDEQLLELAKSELAALGIAKRDQILDGKIIRQPKAYPVYDRDYQKKLAIIRSECRDQFPTLQFVGRNGLHRYNNQDHSMLTAKLAAENILSSRSMSDVWDFNIGFDYLEGGGSVTRQVPAPI